MSADASRSGLPEELVMKAARRIVWEQFEGCVQWEDDPSDTATSGDPGTRRRATELARAVLSAVSGEWVPREELEAVKGWRDDMARSCARVRAERDAARKELEELRGLTVDPEPGVYDATYKGLLDAIQRLNVILDRRLAARDAFREAAAQLAEALDALAYMTRTFVEEAEYSVRESTEAELLEALEGADAALADSLVRGEPREGNS